MTDTDAIAARHQEFVAAFSLEDAGRLGEFLTDDHVGMAPGLPRMVGRDAARSFWRQGFSAAHSEFTTRSEAVEVHGDVALDRFEWDMTVEPRDGGPPVHDTGKCVWIWRRDGSDWRLATAIWNSDLPEPALWSGGGAGEEGAAAAPGAPEAAEAAEAAAKRAIQENLDAYTAACDAGDVEAYLDTLTEDAVVEPPDQPAVQGRAELGAWVKEGFFDPFHVTFRGAFDRITVVGSEAFAPGHFTLHLEPRDGSEAIDGGGAFFDVYREVAPGSWKLAHVVFNFDAPMG